MNVTNVIALLSRAEALGTTVAGIGDLITAGEQLIAVIHDNLELATETAGEDDLSVLRKRAAELALKNRALSEQIDAALGG